jgi:hypothetical protein
MSPQQKQIVWTLLIAFNCAAWFAILRYFWSLQH